MRRYSLSHLSDSALLHALATLVARDRATTAALLAHIAEVDDRRLYLPAGYPSMHAYCVDALHLSEDAAFKGIQAARAARRFSALYEAVAAGDLTLTAVNLLAPHLTEGNVVELIAHATHKRKVEIEALLAARFPRSEFLAIGEISTVPHALAHVDAAHLTTPQLAPAQVGAANSLPSNTPISHSVPDAVHNSRLTPVARNRYLLHVPIDRATHDKLQHAAALLSHSVPSGDLAQVLDRALDTLIERLERRKCAKTEHPRPRRRQTPDSRHVPAQVRRAVWERDRGQCTFVGDSGHRCGARTRLEFDHVEPVARGGRASVATIRLRCRAHNQYEAERVFGAEFMQARRAAAQQRAAQSRDMAEALRTLGFRADEIRRGVAYAESLVCVSLEAQVSAALRWLTPMPRRS